MNCKFEFIYSITRKSTEYINFHKHNCFELVYYLSGSGHTTIGDKEYTYSENSYSIVLPNTMHDERHYVDTSVLFIGFSYSPSESGNISIDIPLNSKEGVYFGKPSISILNFLEKMQTEFASKQNLYNLKLDLLVAEMLIELHRSEENRVVEYNEIEYIKMFIHENYNQNIDLQTLAELSGYSYHHFRHIFKDKVGLSPMNYIINVRIKKAKQLLIGTKLPISTIAQECGFSNHSQFSLVFKKVIGFTPIVYRSTRVLTND